MSTLRLYRVIVPVGDIESAAVFYGTLFAQPGARVSPGRHYFVCGDVTLAMYSPRADGDERDPRPNFDLLRRFAHPLHRTTGVTPLGSGRRRAMGLMCRPTAGAPWPRRTPLITFASPGLCRQSIVARPELGFRMVPTAVSRMPVAEPARLRAQGTGAPNSANDSHHRGPPSVHYEPSHAPWPGCVPNPLLASCQPC